MKKWLIQTKHWVVAAIAPWFRLRLPSYCPGFESQTHHLCFFQFVLLKLYRENNENKQKETGIGPIFLKQNIGKRRGMGTSHVITPIWAVVAHGGQMVSALTFYSEDPS